MLQALLGPVDDDQVMLELSFLRSEGSGSISHARGESVWDGERPALPPEHLCASYRLSLLALSNDGDHEKRLARRVHRELAGGFDLKALAASGAVSGRHGQNQWKALQQAQRAQAQVLTAYDQLVREQKGLAAKQAALGESQQAKARLEQLEIAQNCLELQLQIQGDEDLLRAMPEGWRDLPEKAEDQVEAWRQELISIATEVSALGGRRQQLEQEISQLGLAEPVDQMLYQTWRRRARDLAETERVLKEQRLERASQIPVAAAADRPADLPDGERMERLIQERGELQAKLNHLTLRSPTEEQDSREPPKILRRGQELLAQWSKAARPRELPAWLLFIFFLMLLLGLVLGVQGQWLGYVVAALGGLVIAWSQRRSDDPRPALQQLYEDTGLPRPEQWDDQGVDATLGDLSTQLGLEEEALLQAKLHEKLQHERAQVEAQLAVVTEELAGMAQALGLDLEGSVLGMREALAGFAAHRQLQALDGSLEALQAEFQATQQEAFDHWGSHGLTEGASAAALEACLDLVSQRSQRLEALGSQVDQLDQDDARLAKGSAEVQAKLDAVMAGGGDEELSFRITNAQRARKAEGRLEDNRQQLEQKIVGLEDSSLLGEDMEALSRLAREQQEMGAQEVDLAAEIAATERAVSDARQEAKLRRVDQDLDEARETLASAYQDGLERTADLFLAEGLKETFRLKSAPRLLRRMQERLDQFTGARYGLEVDGESFLAQDRLSGRRLSLDQLSHGNRIQVLLAARLAFIDEHEQGACLPLFLDEALATTDPERFEAVATVLLHLADEGRQVFYLSSKYSDVHRWNRVVRSLQRSEPTVMTLGTVAKLQAYEAPGELEAPGLSESPEAFAQRIGVPPFGLWSPVESLDLFYLLEDRLDLVHKLRGLRQRRLGPYADFRLRALNPGQLDDDNLALLDARIAVFRSFLHLARDGRGAPVEADAFADSRIKPKSRELLTDVLDEVGGDGEILLERVKAREGARFKGIQRNLADLLSEALTAAGYIDEQKPLDPAQRLVKLVEMSKAIMPAEPIAELDSRWSQRLNLVEVS